jgi:ATP-dependent DNA helicase PIF1
MQLKFIHIGLLVIDEKSMIGQKQLFYVHKRLQEARPDKGNELFGGLSIVLLGDWKQLPPVLDNPLYLCGGRKAYYRSATCLHVNLQPLLKELV